jgi:hypothetical protein
MTEHYANHVTDKLARTTMAAMPALFGAPTPAMPLPPTPDVEALRAKVAAAAATAGAEVLERMLAATTGRADG